MTTGEFAIEAIETQPVMNKFAAKTPIRIMNTFLDSQMKLRNGRVANDSDPAEHR
jgi:hypothetical protein